MTARSPHPLLVVSLAMLTACTSSGEREPSAGTSEIRSEAARGSGDHEGPERDRPGGDVEGRDDPLPAEAQPEESPAASRARGGGDERAEEGAPERERSLSPLDALDVFFIGHSLINWTMPNMLASVARESGRDHGFGGQIINGAPLRYQWEHAEEAEGMNAREVLPRGEHDTLVLTEALPLRTHLEWNDPIAFASRFASLLLEERPNARIYVFETWHELGSEPEWRRRIATDRALWLRIAEGVASRTEAERVLLVPGGAALARLVERTSAGDVPGLDDPRDLFADDIHMNDLGNYFIAMVMYATLYRRSPVGLSRRTRDNWGSAFEAPSAELARSMQETAWEVVREDPAAGIARP